MFFKYLSVILLIVGCQNNEKVEIKTINPSKDLKIEIYKLGNEEKITLKTFKNKNIEDLKNMYQLNLSSFNNSKTAYPDFVSRYQNCPMLKEISFVQTANQGRIKYFADENYNSTFCEVENVKFNRLIKFQLCESTLYQLEAFTNLNNENQTLKKLLKKIECK